MVLGVGVGAAAQQVGDAAGVAAGAGRVQRRFTLGVALVGHAAGAGHRRRVQALDAVFARPAYSRRCRFVSTDFVTWFST